MNITEVIQIIEIVRRICPAQRFDDEAPEAWLLVLEDISFTTAREALRGAARAQDWITPRAIRDQAMQIRDSRIQSVALRGGDGRLVAVPEDSDPIDYDHLRVEDLYLRQLIGDGLMDIAAYRAYRAAGRALTQPPHQLTSGRPPLRAI